MATLLAHPDFQKFLAFLAQSREEIRSESELAKDEVILRWHQGAAQVLTHILESCQNSTDTLRKFR